MEAHFLPPFYIEPQPSVTTVIKRLMKKCYIYLLTIQVLRKTDLLGILLKTVSY